MSLTAFFGVYVLVFGAGVLLLLRVLAKPPLPGEHGPMAVPSHTAPLPAAS